ncbi:unnamed protein product [Closterium sp. Yama58-4]|nr:unnamed protein product [Closterium sp. Yama58-4]
MFPQRYAAAGYRTCLVVQSQDRVADRLLGMRLTPTPQPVPAPAAAAGDAAAADAASQTSLLCALRVETTKLLLAPLEVIKKADERLGITQGALAEECGIQDDGRTGEAEVEVFDGPTTWEVLQILASLEKSRWYLRRFRALAERTDIGRVALPSVARLLDSIVGSSKGGSGSSSSGSGSGGEDGQRSTAEIWEKLDSFLSKAVSAFADPYRTSVFLLADTASHSSVDTCRRIWGCAVQAGVSPSGVFLLPSDVASEGLAEKFSPLPVAELPVVSEEAPAAVAAAAGQMSDGAVAVMNGEGVGKAPPAVDVDVAACTVRLFLPGFDKQEVKLQQWKGGAELLVEAGDQRRCVELPQAIQGKSRHSTTNYHINTLTDVAAFLSQFIITRYSLRLSSRYVPYSESLSEIAHQLAPLSIALRRSPRSSSNIVMARTAAPSTLGLVTLLVTVLLAAQRVEAGRFLPSAGNLPTNRLPPSLNSAVAAAGAAASSSNPAAALKSTLSGLQSSLNGQITSLDALLKKSLEKISAALKSSPSAAEDALQTQISTLKANLAALNESLVNLKSLNNSGSDLNVTDFISSQISGIRSNISSISTGIAALNKDLDGIIGSRVGSGVGSGAGLAGALRPAAGAASTSGSAAIRAAVRQRLAAVTQRVAGLNGNVSALVGMVTDLHSALSSALDGALDGALNDALNGALNGGGGVSGGVVGNLANLLPQQAGMLRAVLTSCNGLLSLQAGAADIQILKIGSNYMLTYYLYVAGVTKAPDPQAIVKGSACGTAAASAALALPGTWVPMSPVSWSLANAVRASAADVADVLASIQGITNDDLYIGFSGENGTLSGRMMGGRV